MLVPNRMRQRTIYSPRPREACSRARRRFAGALACVALALAGAGCGAAQGTTTGTTALAGGEPPPVTSSLSHHEELIAAGGNLAIADGCSTCHTEAQSSRLGPSFYSFAGHDVRLASGRTVLVNEAFVKRELENPEREPMSGYSPRLMWNTLRRLHVHLDRHSIEALAAFVEQIGPEP